MDAQPHKHGRRFPLPVQLIQPEKIRAALGSVFCLDFLYFTLTLLYDELIFKYATIRTGFGSNLFLMLLFSAAGAACLSVLCGLLKGKAAHVLRAVLLVLLMIPFGTEFFIFQEYNIFYDIRTILNGAGGAATGFLDEIARLVFSVSGISLILLLAIPAVFYLAAGRRLKTAQRPRMTVK